MKRTYKDYFIDMLDAITKAESFVAGLSFEEFHLDYKSIFSVTRAFEILGEAANKIPAEVQAKYPGLPWKEMIGMRNKLIHDYAGVDDTVLWKTLKKEIPLLKITLNKVIDSYTE